MSAYPPDFLVDRVLYRDGLILVIDKPAGISVHQGPSGADNLENYFEALKFGLPRAPALAHRLDRDTSGCLILGRHRKALAKLGKLFQQNRIEKTYWAISRGRPQSSAGTIDLPLKKVTGPGGWRIVAAPDGQQAATDYRVISSVNGLTFIEAKPKTGRTHQIRLHLASIGCPILGDPFYGDLAPADRDRPLMLHARSIVIPISKDKAPVAVAAAPPKAMADLIGEGLLPDTETP